MSDRTPTAIDAVADDYVDTLATLSPTFATGAGVPGDERALDDFSPTGHDAMADAAREVLRRIDEVELVDDVDRVTAAAMRERLGLEVELHEAGENYADLNNIASPLQAIRDTFDLMPTDTEEHWKTIAARMGAVPGAVDGYLESLNRGAEIGVMPALRQVKIGIEQAEELAGRDSFWSTFAASADVPDSLRADLEAGAEQAKGAYRVLADALRELAPKAPLADGVGRERYQRFSRRFLGAAVDLDETYEWGREELARIIAEQEDVANQLYGEGTTPEEAMQRLDDDTTRQLHGTDALQRWMQETSDAAVAELADVHFDIPGPLANAGTDNTSCRSVPTSRVCSCSSVKGG